MRAEEVAHHLPNLQRASGGWWIRGVVSAPRKLPPRPDLAGPSGPPLVVWDGPRQQTPDG